MAQTNLLNISESEVKAALIEYVNSHDCMRLKPIEKIRIGTIDVRNAFQYTLESFTEKRETKPKHVPYRGQPYDGIQNGPIPYKWDVMVTAPPSFSKVSVVKTVLPHSEEVKVCHRCRGKRYVTCSTCGGSGREKKSQYNSTTGETEEKWKTCFSCGGSGKVKCSTCSGRGKLLWYLQLKILWETYHNDCFINDVPSQVFPNKLIEKSDGEIVFTERNRRVLPVQNFPNVAVGIASAGFFDEHANYECQSEKILEQRHQIKSILIAIIDYEYKKKVGKFYIYGNQHKVYFPKYPGNCFRFCTLV